MDMDTTFPSRFPSRTPSPRPETHRKRSNSFPIVEALGCTTPEAKLILAEGRAAVRSRNASRHKHGRRHRSENTKITTFRPQDHMHYLDKHNEADVVVEDQDAGEARSSIHTRILSNGTDDSVSTVTGPSPPPPDMSRSKSTSPISPLGDYSANLAQFIKRQLNSIPSYQTMSCPRSCPDLSRKSKTPPQSPTKTDRRPVDIPHVLEMPPIRPPLRSHFSAWSSTDDETDDGAPPLPSVDLRKHSHTPSILRYYENCGESSFLFTNTPLDEDENKHPNAEGFTFPDSSMEDPPKPTSDLEVSAESPHDYPSSSISTRPQLTSSSAPSISSVSTISYFDCKRPISLAPHIRDRIVAAVSPSHFDGKVIIATSPFEGDALANVHDILVESQDRVLVDGLSFDLVRNFDLPAERMRVAPRIPTPC